MNVFRLRVLVSVLAFSLLLACSEKESPKPGPQLQLDTIEGQVDFAARGRLPVDSTLYVELIDITEGSDDPIVLAATQTAANISSPYDFELAYDPAVIFESRIYRVRAQIRKDDALIDDSAGMQDPFAGIAIELRFLAPPKLPGELTYKTISLQGFTWFLVEMDGEPVVLEVGARPSITVDAKSNGYSGFAGCNRFTGSYELNGTTLSLGNAAVTRMACQNNMDLEDRYLKMLGKVGSWRLENQQVVLGDADRNVLARFALPGR